MRLFLSSFLAILTLIGISISLSGCEYTYRYPCQDPENWNKSECNNEACKADGTCTTDVLGPKFFRDNQSTDASEMSNSETTDTDTENNTDSTPPVQLIENKMVHENGNKSIVHDPESDEYANDEPSRTPPSMDTEVPLTMNTVVDTAAHNAATK